MTENTDTGDEVLGNTQNIKSEKSTDENIPSSEPDIITPKQETENMEIHAPHLHHGPGKKFSNYLYEFLMMFLAVFCGFLAENFREHRDEKERAKEYIHSFYNDLKTDSSTFSNLIIGYQSSVRALEDRKQCYDLIKGNLRSAECLVNLFNNSRAFTDLISADQTLQQLKNSGNFRLLNYIDADSILLYDKMIRTFTKEETTGLQEIQYNMRGLIYSLQSYEWATQQNRGAKLPILFSENRKLLNKYFNSLDEYFMRTNRLLSQLVLLRQKALELIEYFKNKYHFE